jgi:phosphoribosylformimino-5-aminoimidazole carboxamide ribotide isomerase
MHGQVVRGIAGHRDEYRPWHSPLCPDARPATLARSLHEQFHPRELYVADLDAIAGGEPAWDRYQDLAAHGARLCLDAGVTDPTAAGRLAAWRPAAAPPPVVVLGLESLADPATLAAIVAAFPAEARATDLVFSLDLKHGLPLAGPGFVTLDAFDCARLAYDLGLRRLIVLDIAAVGTQGGPVIAPLCHRLSATFPDVEFIAGGGIRHEADLIALARSGCRAALVATALHTGAIDPATAARWLV